MRFISAFLFVFAMFAVSCEGPVGPQGETGPQGEQGVQGTPGQPGEDGQDYEIRVYTGTIPSDDQNDGYWEYIYTIPRNNESIVSVHVRMSEDSVWLQPNWGL